MTDKSPVIITVELTDAEAWYYAQFLKRSTWYTYREHAESDADARLMQNAEIKMRQAFADAGYAPR